MCVLERERELGGHQTGHNSGVIHAGVYYVPGSLKARLCVEGAREMYEYCEQRGIATERCGKVIVATDASELDRLDELERRGRANGVPGLRRIDAAGIEELEPTRAASPACTRLEPASPTSPRSRARTRPTLLDDGGDVVTGCEVTGVAVSGRSLRLAHSHGTTEATNAIFCAGAWADRLAVAAGADPDPRIVPFRGAYLRLAPERRHLVRSLIYPVPDPSLPFLGVHLTKHIGGEVLIGPTALMAGARDAYSLATVRRRDLADTLLWPGTWKMLARWWRTGAERAAPRRAALGVRPRCRALRARPATGRRRARVRRRPRAGARPRRQARRRLRVLAHRARPARAQRPLSGRHLLARDRPPRRR